MINKTLWTLDLAKLYCEQINEESGVLEATEFAEANLENISGDIGNNTPQDCIDAEIDEMRSCM